MKRIMILMGMVCSSFLFTQCSNEELENIAPEETHPGELTEDFKIQATAEPFGTDASSRGDLTIDDTQFCADFSFKKGDTFTSHLTYKELYSQDEQVKFEIKTEQDAQKGIFTKVTNDAYPQIGSGTLTSVGKIYYPADYAISCISATQTAEAPQQHVINNLLLTAPGVHNESGVEFPKKINFTQALSLMKVTVTNDSGEDLNISKYVMTASQSEIAGLHNSGVNPTQTYAGWKGVSKSATVNFTSNAGSNNFVRVANKATLDVYFLVKPFQVQEGETISMEIFAQDVNNNAKGFKKDIIFSSPKKLPNFEAGKYNRANLTLDKNTAVVSDDVTDEFLNGVTEYFKKEALYVYDIDNNGKISQNELDKVTTINFDGDNYADILKKLSFFKNLKSLTLTNCSAVNNTTFSSGILPQTLEEINFSYTDNNKRGNITKLDGVLKTNYPNVKVLKLTGHKIQTCGLTGWGADTKENRFLYYFPNVEILDLSRNYIWQFKFDDCLSKLVELYLDNQDLTINSDNSDKVCWIETNNYKSPLVNLKKFHAENSNLLNFHDLIDAELHTVFMPNIEEVRVTVAVYKTQKFSIKNLQKIKSFVMKTVLYEPENPGVDDQFFTVDVTGLEDHITKIGNTGAVSIYGCCSYNVLTNDIKFAKNTWAMFALTTPAQKAGYKVFANGTQIKPAP